MSLWNVKTISPCMSYRDAGACFPGGPPPYWMGLGLGSYNPSLVKCPRHFAETTSGVPKIIYDPSDDKYKVFFMLNTIAWPGWDARRYEFSADTGEWLNSDPASWDFTGIWGMAYTGMISLGSFNKIYAGRNDGTYLCEVASSTLSPVAGGWSVDPYYGGWVPRAIYHGAVVNRIDNILAGLSSSTIDHWRNINTTPEKFATTMLPGVPSYMCYENRNYLWVIMTDGTICKVDYKIPRYEMISTVQNPDVTSLGFAIAFDTKRKRLVVFRAMPDAADGSCRHQLEFYYPMVNPVTLTDPVPVTTLRAGKTITFVSHLIGEAGEGVSPYMVNAQLEAPIDGSIISPFSGSELSGRVSHRYKAPATACEDTIQLDVSVEETI